MTLDRLSSFGHRLVKPGVSVALKLNLTPNQISVISLSLAVVSAVGFYLGQPITYVLGSLLVALNGLLDVLDGELAREMGIESKRGDFLDHVFDRYADMIILVGIIAGIDRWFLGFLAFSGVILTSYMGTQAQAVGGGREYGGLIGRADRLVIIFVAGILQAVIPELPVYTLTVQPLEAVLVLFALVGHFTAVQRFVLTWRDLS
ncbi:MAG: CDP-alcohol phosphatidyltransferase family protein [Halobacteria archaeon]|nr:CDP-alcohol phosphatidyltransferase family protein [Halobacteria archaeon]